MLNKLIGWYVGNTSKILFLLFVTVIFTLTFVYIPYINVLFSSWAGMLVIYLVWYFLFFPKLNVLLFLGTAAVVVGFLFTLFGLSIFSEKTGEFFYVTLILLLLRLTNRPKLLLERKKRKS